MKLFRIQGTKLFLNPKWKSKVWNFYFQDKNMECVLSLFKEPPLRKLFKPPVRCFNGTIIYFLNFGRSPWHFPRTSSLETLSWLIKTSIHSVDVLVNVLNIWLDWIIYWFSTFLFFVLQSEKYFHCFCSAWTSF